MIGRIILLLVVAAGCLLVAVPALAGKRDSYPGTLVATPGVLQPGEYFDVSGCGYDTSLGNVTIGFGGGSWGSPLDADVCFTIVHIPSTMLPGEYEVSAYQKVRKRWRETGETTVTVVG
jgi:hypothetical protein